MIRICLLVPLTFFINTPHYVILSFHYSFYLNKYGGNFSLIWPVCAIICGIILSAILVHYLIGTFCMLLLSTILFMICDIILMFTAFLTSSQYEYLCVMAIASTAIGMAQPNLAALVGDQYFPATVYHYLIYVLIIMLGIFTATVVSMGLEEFPNIKCPFLDCYSFTYLMCFVSTFLALVLMILMFCMRTVFLIEPLVHQTFHDNVTERLKIFLGIIIPLLGVFIIVLILERELLIQSKVLNLNVGGNLWMQEIHLVAIYYLLTILCLPVAMVLAFLKSNSFMSMALSCLLICLASFYFGLLESAYGTSADNNWINSIDNKSIGFQMFNADDNIAYNFQPMGLQGSLPHKEKTGQLTANQTGLIFDRLKLSTMQNTRVPINLSMAGNNVYGKLVSIFNFATGNYTYLERTYRAPSGYALLRFLCHIETNATNGTTHQTNLTNNCASEICVTSSKFIACSYPSIYNMMEIPGDHYTVTKDNKLIGTYYLGDGGYYALIIVADTELYHDVPFVLIPGYKFSIYCYFLIYLLLAIAKGLIAAVGLHVAYQAASNNQKQLFISAMYIIYVTGWIFFRFIDDVYGFDLNSRMGVTTFIVIALSVWFYAAQYHLGYLLNQNEPEVVE